MEESAWLAGNVKALTQIYRADPSPLYALAGCSKVHVPVARVRSTTMAWKHMPQRHAKHFWASIVRWSEIGCRRGLQNMPNCHSQRSRLAADPQAGGHPQIDRYGSGPGTCSDGPVHCMPNPNVTTELGTFLGRIRADIQLRAVDGGFNGLPVDRPLTFWAWISYV